MLFSDAVDTSSTLDPETLVAVAQRTTASFSAVVAQATTGPSPLFRIGPGSPVLQRLAVETGGSVFTMGPVGDLSAVFRRAVEQFRSSYVLHFSPTGVERTGYHALKVTVKGRERLIITARRGYFW